MIWEGRRESENVEDRRPVSSVITDRFLGAVELLNERDSGKLIGLIPTDFNENCTPTIREQLDMHMFEESLKFFERVLGNSARTPEHEAEIQEARKSMIDHRQQSLFKMTFDPRSCESQLARFYNLAGGLGLDVTFEALKATEINPAAAADIFPDPAMPGDGTEDPFSTNREDALAKIVPTIRAVQRFGF